MAGGTIHTREPDQGSGADRAATSCFNAGTLTKDVDPERLPGPAFPPLVSLSDALILYDAGLALDMRKLTGHTRRVVIRLILLGVPVSFLIGVGTGLAGGIIGTAALWLLLRKLRLGEVFGTSAQPVSAAPAGNRVLFGNPAAGAPSITRKG
jgi:hypothetical protein